MKAQSAVEFLTTYSFVLVILAAAILVVFFLVSTTRTEIGAQCSSFGSVTCNLMGYYSNKAQRFSLATFLIANKANGPVNVTNLTVTLREVNYTGVCVPGLLYPGRQASCMANLTTSAAQGLPVQGFYNIRGKFCNSPISNPILNCSEKVSFSGSFYAYSQPFTTPIYAVLAAVGNSTSQIAAYNGMPQLPPGYTIVNNGDWAPKSGSSGIAYAYGTSGWSGNYFGIAATQFPSSLSYLNNNAIACSPGYNSTLSLASTNIYLSSQAAVTFGAYADNAIAAWYLPKGSTTWNSIYNNAYWPANSVSLASNTVTLGKGLYSIEVEWSNTCGAGLQAFQISGANVIG